jgi:predicted nucleotidyltransferase
MRKRDSPSIRLPGQVHSAGTQVVLKANLPVLGEETSGLYRKAGNVGIVSECPDTVQGDYVVQFTDGSRVRASFDQLALRRAEIDTELTQRDFDFGPHVIFECQVGSKAFGLSTEDSDDDIRGVFLPPAALHWSLFSLPEQFEAKDESDDFVFWEIEKFLRLALKANPNILETLWTPMVVHVNEVGKRLLKIRESFLSQHLYKTYSGYVLSQFRKMEKAQQRSGTFKPKHAMHLIRLLRSGIEAVKTGAILVDVGAHREQLLDIRNGKMTFEEIRALALSLDSEFQKAFESTSLPEQPDFERVDEFLVWSRRWAAENDESFLS